MAWPDPLIPMPADAERVPPDSPSITHRIAEAVSSLRYEQLPDALVRYAKRLIADTLLVAAAGASVPSSRSLRSALPAGRVIGEVAEAGEAFGAVWFLPQATHGEADAAFINTLHAAALDFDTLNGAVHADLVCLPPAWAAAHARGASGRTFLVAYLAASELMSRLARAATKPATGWSATSLYGGLGAALATGKVLDLPVLTLRHAMGLAIAQAAGTQQANLEQVLSKRLQPARAVRQGMFSARLAEAGASAPAQALEGRFGLRALTQPGDDSSVPRRLWDDWQVLDTAFKRYPVCACSHAAMEACAVLCRQHRLQAGDVHRVIATISPFMDRLVGAPFSPGQDPQVTAQFSLRYQLAAICLRGTFGLRDLEPSALFDEGITALLPRISIVVDPRQQGELAPAHVAIELRAGGRIEARCDALPGTPEHPLPDREWRAKLADCGARAPTPLAGNRLEALLERIDTIERIDDMRTFWDAIHKR